MQWEYLQGSVPILALLIGLLSSTYLGISREHWTTSWCMLLIPHPCFPPVSLLHTLMQIMEDARTLVAPLVPMLLRWEQEPFHGVPSYSWLLHYPQLKQSTSLQSLQVQRSAGLGSYSQNLDSTSHPLLLLCALTTSLHLLLPRIQNIMGE